MIQSPIAKNEVIDLLDPHLHPLTVLKQGLIIAINTLVWEMCKWEAHHGHWVVATRKSHGADSIKGSPAGVGGLLLHCTLGPWLDPL